MTKNSLEGEQIHVTATPTHKGLAIEELILGKIKVARPTSKVLHIINPSSGFRLRCMPTKILRIFHSNQISTPSSSSLSFSRSICINY